MTRTIFLFCLFSLMTAPGWAASVSATLDCETGAAVPPYPAIDAQPAVSTWFSGDGLGEWQPPACTGWQARDSDVLVATAARFRSDGGIDGVVNRLAGVSGYTAIRYWSVSRQTWRPLITAAHALASADRNSKRADFAASDFVPGVVLHFWQEEATPADELVYRLEVRERSANRLLIALSNASEADYLLVTLFDPGDFQTFISVHRETGDTWRYYALQRASTGVDLSTRSHRASYVNRAAALFRFIAGQPTDAEPPLAPH